MIGSMDVKGLYPNCKKTTTQLRIEEAVKTCKLEFEEINTWYLIRFLSILCKGKSGRQDLDRYLLTPKPRTTLNSWIRRKSDSQFNGPPELSEAGLSQDDVRALLGLALGKSVGVVISNH